MMSLSDPELDPSLADTRPGKRVRMRMPSPPEAPVRHRALHPVETMGDLAGGLTVAAAVLLVDRSSAGIGMALTLAVLGYTVWHDAAAVANRVSLRRRNVASPLVLVVVALLVMTLATPGVMATAGIAYAAAYWVARLALVRAVWARPEFGYGLNSYTMSVCFSGPLLAVGCVAEGDARLAIWVSAALHDVAVPYVLRGRSAGVGDPEHFAERYAAGLGTVVLGGAVVLAARGVPVTPFWAWGPAVVALAVLIVALWWAYVAVLRPAQVFPSDDPGLAAFVVSYGHLALAGGVVLAYGGSRLVFEDPLRPGGWWVSGLLFGGLLLAYGGLAAVSSWLLRRPQWPLWAAVAGCCVLIVAGPYVPAVATLGLAALGAAAVAVTARPQLRPVEEKPRLPAPAAKAMSG